MILPILLAAAIWGQTPATETPSQELVRLAKEDQDDRHFTAKPDRSVLEEMSKHDRVRRARVEQILASAPTLDAQGFSSAALIFQHGEKPQDYLLAHELAACSCLAGQVGSLVALAEDRLLDMVHRPQRFGTQFDWNYHLQPVYEGPDAVDDDLRLDFLVPPLSISRRDGMNANAKAETMMFKRVSERREHRENLKDVPALAKMEAEAANVPQVLALYHAKRIQTDADLARASEVLQSSPKLETILLAHDFATLALIEGYRPAARLFMTSWDKVAPMLGMKPRYSGGDLPPSVRAELQIR